MSFKINDRPTFTREVKVTIPDADATRTETLKVTFRVTSSEGYDLGLVRDQRKFLTEAVTALDDLIDDDGKPVAYDAAMLPGALGLDYFRLAMMSTYSNAVATFKAGN